MNFLIYCIWTTVGIKFANGDINSREGKYFPLFNLVSFQNEECSSDLRASSGNGRRIGTCLTNSECVQKGGSAQGSCAAGFGTCCIFAATASSSNVRENCSYVQNPGFPNPLSRPGSVTYTVSKSSSSVCFLRLDFETFSILATGKTADATTGMNPTPDDDITAECRDKMDIRVSSGQTIPTICGENRGQHMYVDLGSNPSDSALITFQLGDDMNGAGRAWDIKITQYGCNSEQAPPNGCLQYHTSSNGRIKTFNFDSAMDNHLPNQQYSICLRQEVGYCCVQYFSCQDEDNSFSLGGLQGTTNRDSSCNTQDFIRISDSQLLCTRRSGASSFNKLCGNDVLESPICDCSPPFSVDIFTNASPDLPNDVTDTLSRGICLDYRHVPCDGL